MSSEKARVKKRELKVKEELLREKLNQTSDDVEKNALKILGLAALGGLASFVLYKVLSGSEDDSEAVTQKKSNKKKKKPVENQQSKINKAASGWQSKALESTIKAGLPIVINLIDDFIKKQSEKKEETEEGKN